MGTRYSAIFFAPDGIDESAIGAALLAAADKVDRQMSTWKSDSDLSRLNATPAQQWVEVPAELMTVLDTALRTGVESGGAFDIGVGDLVNAWGFGPAGPTPDEKQTSALKRHVHKPAFEVLEIDHVGKRVRKRAAIALDLSGIAKGYGVDALARCLDGFGITRYLVGIDGEMRAKGHKPDGQAWAVAIEKPLRHVREVMGVMELEDAAIATSGDYRHWVEVDGMQHSHTMSPSGRQPARNRLAAVTVVMNDCMLADAWATALLVLGDVTGVELAQKRGMDVLFVLRDGDGFREVSIVDGQRQP
ncbi:FAD:protein FMN transferase [Luteimonas sp. MJ250]|uniref:FAD:protein FMN transferase n=1 Tax=Luteimonas sp. MJ250 TaxID=3129236 RepID=UPI0031B9B526